VALLEGEGRDTSVAATPSRRPAEPSSRPARAREYGRPVRCSHLNLYGAGGGHSRRSNQHGDQRAATEERLPVAWVRFMEFVVHDE